MENIKVVDAVTNKLKGKNPWVVAAVGGSVILVGVAAVVVRQIQKQTKKLPSSGTYETIRCEGVDLVEGTTVRVTFNDKWMDVYAGGNDMTGTLMRDGTRVYWSEEASTEIGCMPNIAVQDGWLSVWLNAGPSFFRDHRRLVMSRGGIKLVFHKLKD